MVHYSSTKFNILTIDSSHKPHNALDRYPTMYHFVTEMCTFLLQNGASWDMGLMHFGICAVSLLNLSFHSKSLAPHVCVALFCWLALHCQPCELTIPLGWANQGVRCGWSHSFLDEDPFVLDMLFSRPFKSKRPAWIRAVLCNGD